VVGCQDARSARMLVDHISLKTNYYIIMIPLSKIELGTIDALGLVHFVQNNTQTQNQLPHFVPVHVGFALPLLE
jgi:hypothetical protein